MSKKKAQVHHFQKRIGERFGLHGRGINQRITGMIQRGKATFVERQSNRVTVWLVEFEGRRMKVVYDRVRKVAVTAMFTVLPAR